MDKDREKESRGRFKILVVDDDTGILDLFVRLFGKSGQVSLAKNGEDAIALAKNTKYNLAFIDISLPGIDGADVVKELKKISPDTTSVIMSGYEIGERIKHALENGAVGFVKKPFDIGNLLTIKETARLLHMAELTVYRLAKKGELPAVKIGNSWRILKENLEKMIKEGAVKI